MQSSLYSNKSNNRCNEEWLVKSNHTNNTLSPIRIKPFHSVRIGIPKRFHVITRTGYRRCSYAKHPTTSQLWTNSHQKNKQQPAAHTENGCRIWSARALHGCCIMVDVPCKLSLGCDQGQSSIMQISIYSLRFFLPATRNAIAVDCAWLLPVCISSRMFFPIFCKPFFNGILWNDFANLITFFANFCSGTPFLQDQHGPRSQDSIKKNKFFFRRGVRTGGIRCVCYTLACYMLAWSVIESSIVTIQYVIFLCACV